MSERWTRAELFERAARAAGKIDLWGTRGVSLVSTEEIEAMAGALVALGLVTIPPGAATPARLVITQEKPDVAL